MSKLTKKQINERIKIAYAAMMPPKPKTWFEIYELWGVKHPAGLYFRNKFMPETFRIK